MLAQSAARRLARPATSASSSSTFRVQQRLASNTTNPTTSTASGARSPALPIALAIGAIVGGVMLFSKSKTGEADNIGKAMAKTATPANSSGGLGKMEADPNRPLQMGGAEVEDHNPRAPTRKQ